ncbi:MAG: acetyl-CoA carboxylase biotin carboxyl carrier protein [Candidatus Acidiferrales bacterium]
MTKKPKSKVAGVVDAGGVDLAEVERLLAFMEKHGLEEFEYARGGVHIRLKKPSATPVGDRRATLPADEAPRVTHEAPSGRHVRAAEPGAVSDVHVIKSPIVGTFYSAPSPNADSFVAVGAIVEPGQVLCIIEAMKLMNEIESDVAGEVVQIFVENGKPVEYGEPLFGIRTRGKK